MLLAIGIQGGAALAQDNQLAELDALSANSDTSALGLALARSQIAGGDLLGALATLDRVLMANPAAKEARLLHASLLCRVDDQQGGYLAFASLKKRDFAGSVWAEAIAPCTNQEATPVASQPPRSEK